MHDMSVIIKSLNSSCFENILERCYINILQVKDRVTDTLVVAPAIVHGLVIEDIAHYIFVESKRLGFKLQWDGHDYLYLEVSYTACTCSLVECQLVGCEFLNFPEIFF